MNRPKETKNPNQLQFLTSAVDLKGCPSDQADEVAIVGRSNAGKSSLINCLAKARIAQVSGTPGKTRLLNFYNGPDYRLVDMPGYGFAARSGNEQSSWRQMIEPYLAARANLTGLLIVMDIRRDWSDDEENLLKWLEPRELPAVLVLTKADKMSRSAGMTRLKAIQNDSGLEDVLMVSSSKKTGFVELNERIIQRFIEGSDE